MKAFLLAAGVGRRLRPLTESVPKCLVPIRGVPLLAAWLQLLQKHGVTRVLVNLHHSHEHVRAFLERSLTPVSVETTYESSLLGSAGTVLANRGFVAGESRFLVLYADVLTNADLTKLIRFHDEGGAALTLGVVPTGKPKEKGTVVLGPGGRVVEFAEKAEHPRSNLANAGIYVATQELFAHLPAAAPADSVLDFGHHVLPRMVPNLLAYLITDFLMDVGTPDDYRLAQMTWPGLTDASAVPGTLRC